MTEHAPGRCPDCRGAGDYRDRHDRVHHPLSHLPYVMPRPSRLTALETSSAPGISSVGDSANSRVLSTAPLRCAHAHSVAA